MMFGCIVFLMDDVADEMDWLCGGSTTGSYLVHIITCSSTLQRGHIIIHMKLSITYITVRRKSTCSRPLLLIGVPLIID